MDGYDVDRCVALFDPNAVFRLLRLFGVPARRSLNKDNMRVTIFVMTLVASQWAWAAPQQISVPASETVMDILTRGAERMAVRDYAGALATFQRCAVIAPKDDRCPYNAGQAAYLDGKFTIAAEHWKRAKALDASNWRVHAKLIQSYQGAGNLRARDAERAELFSRRSRAAERDELRTTGTYCRDQWTFGTYRVMAMEYFDTSSAGPMLHHQFLIGKDGGEEGSQWLALVSMPTERGRSYALMKFAGESTSPVFLAEYASWNTEPWYDEVRKEVVAIVQGSKKPLRGEPLTLP